MFSSVTLKFHLGFCLLFLYKALTFSELDKFGLVVLLHWPKSLLLQETKSVQCYRKTRTIVLANPLSTFNFFSYIFASFTYFPLLCILKKFKSMGKLKWWFLYSFSSVQSLSRVWLFATPWMTARQASLSITNARSSLRLMSIELVMPSSHLILCCPLLLLPPIPPSIRVFSNESVLCIRWPKCWSFSFSISPSKEHPGLISFRMDWLDLLAVQGTLRVFSNTTVQKHQLFRAQLSLWSNSHIHAWLLEKP